MDIEKAFDYLENFEKIKLTLTNRDKILDYSINQLKISYDVFGFLNTLKFNKLSEKKESLSIEEAIIKANIVRITHFIHSIVILSENKSTNIETLQVLQRIHFESCINLLYITKETTTLKIRISNYINKSLKDLREILNKELRPNELDKESGFKNPIIANRIEGSINEVLNRVGIKENEITNNSSWGSFKSRYTDVITDKNFYNLSYSSASSSVHGNFDLVFKYYTNGNTESGFSLNNYPKKNDFRVISAINSYSFILMVHLVKTYLSKEDTDKIKFLINKLIDINKELISQDEEFLI
ncbi:MAG: hypothetical protein H7Y10_15540 [Flavobacterium sp.]|nr:hypothetical protein [Flavobacterium sp.]